MRAPKSAEIILLNMRKEVDGARSFLREVSAGRAGNDGPYFSPCRARGADNEKSIKSHPLSVPHPGPHPVPLAPPNCLHPAVPCALRAQHKVKHKTDVHLFRYRTHVSADEEYEMLLSSQAKKTRQEPAKEAALQRTVNMKLRQATQELLNKRNTLAEKLCRMDDSFADREKSYKMQMQTFTQQIKKEQATRVRAESQADTYKTAAENQTANVQALAQQRDAMHLRLQQVEEACHPPPPSMSHTHAGNPPPIGTRTN